MSISADNIFVFILGFILLFLLSAALNAQAL